MADLDALLHRMEKLESEQSRVVAALAKAESERDSFKKLYLEMLERNRKLEKGLLGQKSERLPKDGRQLSFDVLNLMLGDNAEELPAPGQEVKGHIRRKPTGRKPIPAHLPRVDIEVVPDEVTRAGTDAFERIGEDVTEVLERRPSSLVVARVIKPKFVRKGEKGIIQGETPELPIPRSYAGPGLLSDTIVKRWQDHLPLNRLEGIYERDGIELAKSTLCTWHQQLVPLVAPLISAMHRDTLEQPYVLTDATGVLVLAKEKCRRGHFWVVVAPNRHVLFEYSRRHNSDAVDQLFAGYEGYLVADAHTVYDHLYADGTVTEVNCWAHARRYFFKALISEPDRAREGLAMISALFRIERSIATAPRKRRERTRHKHSRPVVARFFSWCEAQKPELLEDTPIFDAVRYALNQRKGLSRFLDDGRLPLDNNRSERELRRQAVGRKNWIFVGSDEGALANSTFTTLLASCRMQNVEPWSYLRDLFCLLPRWPAHKVLDLAPVNWSETSRREEVERALAANPYRQLTLAK